MEYKEEDIIPDNMTGCGFIDLGRIAYRKIKSTIKEKTEEQKETSVVIHKTTEKLSDNSQD